MTRPLLREKLLRCSCGNECEIGDGEIFCRSCGEGMEVPEDILELLRTEEIWSEKWDSLHTAVADFLNDGAPRRARGGAKR